MPPSASLRSSRYAPIRRPAPGSRESRHSASVDHAAQPAVSTSSASVPANIDPDVAQRRVRLVDADLGDDADALVAQPTPRADHFGAAVIAIGIQQHALSGGAGEHWRGASAAAAGRVSGQSVGVVCRRSSALELAARDRES